MLREVLLLINCSYTYKIQSYYAEKWMHITCTNRPCSLNYSPQPLLLQSNLLVIPVSLSNKRNIHIPFPFWTHTGRKKGIKRKKKKTHQTNEDQFLVNRAITQGEVRILFRMCSRGSLTSWSSVSRAQARGTKTCEWKQQNAASYVWDLNFYRSCLVLHSLCGLLTYLIMNSMAEQRQVHTLQEPRTADRQNKLSVCIPVCTTCEPLCVACFVFKVTF